MITYQEITVYCQYFLHLPLIESRLQSACAGDEFKFLTLLTGIKCIFSVAELSQLVLSVFAQGYLSGLWAGQMSKTVTHLFCVQRDKLNNRSFVQVWYQMIIQELNVFGSIQSNINFDRLIWMTIFYVYLKYQTLTHKIHCLASFLETSWQSFVY